MEEARTDEEVPGADGNRAVSRFQARTWRAVCVLVARLLAKNLGTLVVPVALISVALTVPGIAVVLMNLDGQALIVNWEVRPDAPGPGLVITGFAVTAVLLAAHLVMVAMVVVMTAGVLLERPVPAARALRWALRRSGPMLVLLAPACVVVVALVVGMAFTPLVTRTWLFVALTVAVPALSTCWLLLTVPIVVLEWAGPSRALRRLWELGRGRWGMILWSAMVLMILLPVVFGLGGRWGTSQFTGIDQSIAEAVYATVMGVLMVVVQGTAVTVLTLNPTYPASSPALAPPRGRPMNLDAVADRLPARVTPRRTRPGRAASLAALTLLVLAAPGALYGAYLHANPLSLPAITARDLSVKGNSYDLSLLNGDRAAVTAWTMDSPSTISRDMRISSTTGRANAEVELCDGRDCHRTSTIVLSRDYFHQMVRPAALPDGGIAFAWEGSPKPTGGKAPRDDDPMKLRLTRCTIKGCPERIEESPVIAEAANPGEEHPAVDLTASGNGVLAGVAFDAHDPSRGQGHSTLRLVRCGDMACENPRLLATAQVSGGNVRDSLGEGDQVAIATGTRGRPVVAFEGYLTGAITVISCDDPACRHPVTRQIVGPSADGSFSPPGGTYGVDMVVPPDDRPIIVHRRFDTGEVRLLRCGTPDCASVDAVTVAEPGRHPLNPKYQKVWPNWALALGRDGLPLIVTQDFDRGRLVLLACEVADCSRRETVPLADRAQFRAGNIRGGLHMEVDDNGRPHVLWSPIAGTPLGAKARLLICRDIRCGA